MISNVQSVKHKRGFTIVEMMVVIAILGILASLTLFGFNGWQKGIDERQIKSDITMAASAMENQKNFSDQNQPGYPTAIPSTFKAGSGTTVSLAWRTPTRFCVQGVSKRDSSITFYIDSQSGKTPKPGSCVSSPPAAPAAPSPTTLVVSSDQIRVSWPAVTGATSYQVRYGTGTNRTLSNCIPASTTCPLTGLTPGTTYNIEVVAVNENGASAPGITSATTPSNAPSTPSSNPVLTPSSRTIYAAPDGINYAQYTVTASGSTCSSGQLQWKIYTTADNSIPLTSPPTWSTVPHSTSNSTLVRIVMNRVTMYETVFAKPVCVNSSGVAAEHPSYVHIVLNNGV